MQWHLNFVHRFLLAQLHMDSLLDKMNPGEIRDALDKLAEEIDPAYEQVMVRIENQARPYTDLARKVLSWITYACQQLSVMELQHALAVAPGRSSVDDYIYPSSKLTAVCAGLVVIDEESQIVRFVRKLLPNQNLELCYTNEL